MSDELRTPLPRAFERLADDLTIGRHGDPHVAFAVLVYPDREPAVIAITGSGSGAHDLAVIEASQSAQSAAANGRFFTAEDLAMAHHALSEADGTLRFGRPKKDETLGQAIAQRIRADWESRARHEIETAMKKAANDARYGWKCEICGSGYTERGLKMHQAKAVVCSREIARRGAA